MPKPLRHRRIGAVERVYEGRVFRVEREPVRLPHGRDITLEVVRHRGSVVLVPQPSPGRVVLIRQYRAVVGRWIWELPAGSLEAGEAPARGARRECLEEIGWRPKRLVRLGEYFATPGFCDERMIFYACLDLERPARARPLDPDEDIEPRTVTLREAWRFVERGWVQDMKTIIGIGLASGRIPRQGGRPGTATRR